MSRQLTVLHLHDIILNLMSIYHVVWDLPPFDLNPLARLHSTTIIYIVRLKATMLPLVLHETVPGHHYQNAYNLKVYPLPDYRRHIDYSHYDQDGYKFDSFTPYVEVNFMIILSWYTLLQLKLFIHTAIIIRTRGSYYNSFRWTMSFTMMFLNELLQH